MSTITSGEALMEAAVRQADRAMEADAASINMIHQVGVANTPTTFTTTTTPGIDPQTFRVNVGEFDTQLAEPEAVDDGGGGDQEFEPIGPVGQRGTNPVPYDELVRRSQTDAQDQFGRLKGAKWFNLARYKEIVILGQGGIGSWLSLLHCRIGSFIHIFDMDTYEVHNMSGQLVRESDIGRQKTVASAEICRLFNKEAQVIVNGEYTNESYSSNVVICGFDNMNARKLAFTKWKELLEENIEHQGEEYAKNFFFQDGRLLAEQLQIFNIPGDRPDLIDEYERTHLFEDKLIPEAEDCTFKQTSHCAAMIASHMVGFYTNWLSNSEVPDSAMLPFYFEYVIPFNMTMQDYANT